MVRALPKPHGSAGADWCDHAEMTTKEIVALQQLYQEQLNLSDQEQSCVCPAPPPRISPTNSPSDRSLQQVIEHNDLLVALRTATEGGDRGGGTSRHLRTR